MNRVETAGRRAEDHPLKEPRVGGSVWPQQCCPAFVPRKSVWVDWGECWYCKYADFHLTEPVALDVGVCCWPRVQLQ